MILKPVQKWHQNRYQNGTWKTHFFMFWKILKNGKSNKSFLKHFNFFRIFMFWTNRRGSVLSSFWNCFWCHFGTGFGVILGLVFDQFSCSFLLNFDVIFGGHFWILWCHPPTHPLTHPTTHPPMCTHPPTHSPGIYVQKYDSEFTGPWIFQEWISIQEWILKAWMDTEKDGYRDECWMDLEIDGYWTDLRMDLEMDIEWIQRWMLNGFRDECRDGYWMALEMLLEMDLEMNLQMDIEIYKLLPHKSWMHVMLWFDLIYKCIYKYLYIYIYILGGPRVCDPHTHFAFSHHIKSRFGWGNPS